MKKNEIAKYIDHTLLAATASVLDIIKLCEEAKKYKFASVCVNPCFVGICSNELAGTDVKVCTVIGFPLGATSTASKVSEAVDAINNGADEIDMVINTGSARIGLFNNIEMDVSSVVQASKNAGTTKGRQVVVKVILETCYLDDRTIISCCQSCIKAGADFVKTSTGFGTPKDENGNPMPNGATVHHVELMKKTVGNSCLVKASGGIRSAQTAYNMIKAGADRIGTSSGVKILEDWDESLYL